jgi:hypothetical protein
MDFWNICEEDELFKLEFDFLTDTGDDFAPNPSAALKEQQKHRKKRILISEEANKEMSDWLIEHEKSPQLTRAEENFFMQKYGLTRREVKTAFNNRRQRVLPPLRVSRLSELAWACSAGPRIDS